MSEKDKIMKKKEYMTTGEVLFFCALLCEVVSLMVRMTTIPYMFEGDFCWTVLKMLRYAGYMLIVVKFAFEKISQKEMIVIGGLVLLLGIDSTLSSRELFMMFIFIYGMKGVRFNRIMQVLLPCFIACFAMIVIGSQIGLVDNWVYGLDDGRIRYALGFFYPSHVASVLFYMTILFCYVKKDRLKLWHVILLELINLWQYGQTDTKAGTILTAAALFVFYGISRQKKDLSSGIAGKCLIFAFPGCAFLSLFACLFYGRLPFLEGINHFLTDRIALGWRGIQSYGIHLFGQKIQWVGHGGVGQIVDSPQGVYNYVDCSYMNILLEHGLIVWLVIIAGFTLASVCAVRAHEIYLAAALLFVAGYSMIEPRLLELGFNPFMLVLAHLIGCRESFLESEEQMEMLVGERNDKKDETKVTQA